MTPRQVASCMGRPGVQLRKGSTVMWSYTAPGAAGQYPFIDADPASTEFDYTQFDGPIGGNSFNADLAPPARAECTVDVILDHGRVGALNYLGPNGQPVPQADRCGQIVQACMR